MSIVELHLDRIERARRDGYDKGFNAGEAAGRSQAHGNVDRALGIGFCIGAGVGVVIALIFVPYLAGLVS